MKARDAAGNTSAASATLNVTTSAGSSVTVYYKKGFTTPYIHYRPAGGTWTTAPGVAMPNSEVAGYAKYTVSLGSATQLECDFNNGSGTWDNNGGLNYFIPAGTQTFNAGTITAGAPSTDVSAPSAPTGLAVSSKTATSVSLTWNAVTDPSGIAGYNVYRGGTLVGSPTSTSYTDTGLTAGTAYSYTVKARDTVGNLSAASTALNVTTSSTGATVTFNETASTVMGQNIYVVGSIAGARELEHRLGHPALAGQLPDVERGGEPARLDGLRVQVHQEGRQRERHLGERRQPHLYHSRHGDGDAQRHLEVAEAPARLRREDCPLAPGQLRRRSAR